MFLNVVMESLGSYGHESFNLYNHRIFRIVDLRVFGFMWSWNIQIQSALRLRIHNILGFGFDY